SGKPLSEDRGFLFCLLSVGEGCIYPLPASSSYDRHGEWMVVEDAEIHLLPATIQWLSVKAAYLMPPVLNEAIVRAIYWCYRGKPAWIRRPIVLD
ncbi:hypothetical protein WCT94_04015, partial [Pectobacterium sp. 1950-15]|uniref:hypothetical protein n=1 Tax=Pectobacterium sp. 1950-15 TaxID=3128982 RepID=UPI003019BE4C